MDTNLRQEVYLNNPAPYNRPTRFGRGRKSSSYFTDPTLTAVKEVADSLDQANLQTVSYRRGSKVWLKRQATVVEVYFWGSAKPNDAVVGHYRLLLSRCVDGS